MDEPDHGKPPSLRQMLHSILAGALGVQSASNRQRDFSQGKASHFIALGVAFTLLLVLILVGLAHLALHWATH